MKTSILALLIVGISVSVTYALKAQVPPQQEKTVTITVTITQANTIMRALQELPFKESSDLIYTIQAQAQRQLQPPTVKDTTNHKK